jgi:hypothetical protein
VSQAPISSVIQGYETKSAYESLEQDREKAGNTEGVISKLCELLLHDWNAMEGYTQILSFAARAIGNLAFETGNLMHQFGIIHSQTLV